jgi:hypothetical protein
MNSFSEAHGRVMRSVGGGRGFSGTSFNSTGQGDSHQEDGHQSAKPP